MTMIKENTTKAWRGGKTPLFSLIKRKEKNKKMKKIFYFFIILLLLIVVFLCIHFYQRTNGFEKSYTNIIVSLNDKEIEKISTNQELIIGKSYEFEIKDTLITSKKISFEYEIIPISNLKYQIDQK